MRLWLYHDRLIAIGFSGQKKLDGDPKAIQEIRWAIKKCRWYKC